MLCRQPEVFDSSNRSATRFEQRLKPRHRHECKRSGLSADLVDILLVQVAQIQATCRLAEVGQRGPSRRLTNLHEVSLTLRIFFSHVLMRFPGPRFFWVRFVQFGRHALCRKGQREHDGRCNHYNGGLGRHDHAISSISPNLCEEMLFPRTAQETERSESASISDLSGAARETSVALGEHTALAHRAVLIAFAPLPPGRLVNRSHRASSSLRSGRSPPRGLARPFAQCPLAEPPDTGTKQWRERARRLT